MSPFPHLPRFKDSLLLQQALTHSSYINEYPNAGEDNERLEFLGDAVLNFLSGEFLYKRFPQKPEGVLTPLRAALVDEKQLARFAVEIGLSQAGLMRLSRGAEKDGGRENPNLLSSAFEAVIGAYFLDTESNLDAVRQYVFPLFESVVEQLAIAVPRINFKSRFQEWALANCGENPKYLIIHQAGPDHAKEFTAEVYVAGIKYGEGSGRRKQDAEKCAAEDAIGRLGLI